MKKQGKYKMTVSIFLFINLIILMSVLYFSQYLRKDNTAFVFIAGLFLFIYSFVWFVPTGLKEAIAHWRVGNATLESRVFTHVKNSELMHALTEKYGELPIEPKKQKEIWDNALVKVHDQHNVFKRHLWAFISRDIAVSGFIMLLVFAAGFPEPFLGLLPVEYIIFLMIQYFVLAIVARQASHNFVIQVLEADVN